MCARRPRIQTAGRSSRPRRQRLGFAADCTDHSATAAGSRSAELLGTSVRGDPRQAAYLRLTPDRHRPRRVAAGATRAIDGASLPRASCPGLIEPRAAGSPEERGWDEFPPSQALTRTPRCREATTDSKGRATSRAALTKKLLVRSSASRSELSEDLFAADRRQEIEHITHPDAHTPDAWLAHHTTATAPPIAGLLATTHRNRTAGNPPEKRGFIPDL